MLMGFGHRVYRNYDPRAKIVKQISEEVFALVGREPLVEIAMELERIALTDEYFIKRRLYPNVDFYSGVIYKALGIPTEFFTVLFAVPRIAGWLAHWTEFLDDPENKIVRPRQIYKGFRNREYEGIEKREKKADYDLKYVIDPYDLRREHALDNAKAERKSAKQQ